jgi:UDP-N-acetylglucosamine 2-epimerase (non-hydrolysing)/GDP/UDP-N,N'-diacetylbacillosamine 2-epimerase (hydrolysing)
MRHITAVTVGRSDYGIFQPVFRAIQKRADLRLSLIVAGMHLAEEFGHTVDAIEADGFEIAARVQMLLASDSPEGIAKAMGLGTLGYAQALAQIRPDILLLLGDRFEMHAAGVAAVPFKMPIAHIHGGEITEGAIDDALRHSLTKLSHLHFVSTKEHGQRVIQMGEEPWRVTVSGAPGLDNTQHVKLLERAAFEERFGVRLGDEFLLATYHPVTLEFEQAEAQFAELLAALDEIGMPVLFTMANADTGGQVINRMIRDYTSARPGAHLVENLGTQGIFSAMALASAMIGNSSSGIIEAAQFGLPVVNIGTRQAGRVRGDNVIDTGNGRAEIAEAIPRATSQEFRAGLAGLVNPYGDGFAADRIVDRLSTVELGPRLLVKKFHTLPQ